MIDNMISMVRGMVQHKVAAALVGGTLLAGLPTAAFARHHDWHGDVVVPAPVVIPLPTPCDPTPVDRVWVPPVYQTVTERVWVPAVTRTEIQRVEVPAQYGYRDVVLYDFFGRRHIRQEQVLISPAHCEDRSVNVEVIPAHYEDQTRQQLICDGHWQDAPAPVLPHIEVRLPF